VFGIVDLVRWCLRMLLNVRMMFMSVVEFL